MFLQLQNRLNILYFPHNEQVLGSGYKGTCETDATCNACTHFVSFMKSMIYVAGNLYVVLVLYRVKGEVTCDYLRFWSRAATSAEFHHLALRAVKNHLKGTDKSPLGGRLPTLRRLYVWTDGHASTYKGFQNFGRMAQWPLSPRGSGEQKV